MPTTIDAIAERAGVSRRTVFTSVGSKADVLKLAFDWTLAGDDEPIAIADRPVVQRLMRADDPAEVLEPWIAMNATISERVAPLYLVLVVAADADPEAATLLSTLDAQRIDGARRVVDRVAEVGGLRPGLTTDVASAILDVLIDPMNYRRFVGIHGWSPNAYVQHLQADGHGRDHALNQCAAGVARRLRRGRRDTTATMAKPTISPTTADAAVLTSHASTPPMPAMSCTDSSRECTTSYGPCQPSSSAPAIRMWPPTHTIAAVPTTESTARTFGMPATIPRPIRWARGRPDSTMRRPTSSIFTISATTPYTTAVIRTATTTRMTARDTKPSSMTSLSEITMISRRQDEVGPDGTGDRLLFLIDADRHGGQVAFLLVMGKAVMDLLGALEAEVAAADHEDDLHEHRCELAQHQRCRQDEQDLVLERSLRDPLDDR